MAWTQPRRPAAVHRPGGIDAGLRRRRGREVGRPPTQAQVRRYPAEASRDDRSDGRPMVL